MVLTVRRPGPTAKSGNLFIPQIPETVSLTSLPYFVSAEYLSEMGDRGIAVPDALAAAVLKRKVEFSAGRCCARSALQQQGYRGDAPLAIGSGRAPIWPAGYLGSISHTQGLAIAAVAKNEDWSGIGIDIEHLLQKDAAQSIVAHLATSIEMNVGTAMGLSFEQWLTLIFSAKESLYKALYPRVGRYFDFLDAEVCRLHMEEARIVVRLVTTLSPQCVKGAEYCVRYTYFNNCVATLCLLSAQAAPMPEDR